jgi:hypothetical protein
MASAGEDRVGRGSVLLQAKWRLDRVMGQGGGTGKMRQGGGTGHSNETGWWDRAQ